MPCRTHQTLIRCVSVKVTLLSLKRVPINVCQHELRDVHMGHDGTYAKFDSVIARLPASDEFPLLRIESLG